MRKKSVKFKKVAIIGTGLMGGSLALALKKKKIAAEIIGVARHKKTLRLAKKIRAIDIGSQDLKAVQDAELIILATPVNVILGMARKLSALLKKEAIVTDLGSTKKEIVTQLERVFPNYIGAHPLAGSQESGIEYSRSDMFSDSLCLLTPMAKTKKNVLSKIRSLWKELGARVILLSPAEHDRIIAFVSHLPHLVAFGLMDLIPRDYLKFSASGLRDTTRIAASGAHLWQDIFITNRKEILGSLKKFNKLLKEFERSISREDRKRLSELIIKAKDKRDSLR